jgi:hypothetical protein
LTFESNDTIILAGRSILSRLPPAWLMHLRACSVLGPSRKALRAMTTLSRCQFQKQAALMVWLRITSMYGDSCFENATRRQEKPRRIQYGQIGVAPAFSQCIIILYLFPVYVSLQRVWWTCLVGSQHDCETRCDVISVDVQETSNTQYVRRLTLRPDELVELF